MEWDGPGEHNSHRCHGQCEGRCDGLSLTYKTHWTKVANASDDDGLVPVVGPHGLQILVSGGWGSVSTRSIWLNSVHGEMVTRKLDWAWE